VLLKDEDTEKLVVEKPFEERKRGNFSEIYGMFEIEKIRVNLYDYESLENTLKEITKRMIKKQNEEK